MNNHFYSRSVVLFFSTVPSAVYAQNVEPPLELEQVVVTATREAQKLSETPASIGAVKTDAIQADKPTHPSQTMAQMPGVAVAVTNGEGHTTAIRQPFTTSPVYLFLEDGIPSRSTGFFNHNAMYELNLAQAGGVEVTRGPGSALYGSDAIGGIVNVLTRMPPIGGEAYISLEAGEFGWRRALIGGGYGTAEHGARGDLNLTTTDGWRERTAYDRKSGSLRWDASVGDNAGLKTILGFSNIDQQTGANSPLIRSDFKNNPTLNYLPIAFRKVDALRLSTNYEHQFGNSLLSLTPYFRDNSMDLLASFRLRFDPTVSESENKSYGLMAKWRTNFSPLRAKLIGGIDIDVSPGSRKEFRLNVVTSGSAATRQFLSSTRGTQIYDYDVEFRGMSPYIHGEISPTTRLRITAGLRYDQLRYQLANRNSGAVAVSAGTSSVFYGQAADTTKTFQRASPKLGATFAITAQHHLYGSLNYGFRAPSEGDLFRPSNGSSAAAAQVSAQAASELKPIKARQLELGVRGQFGPMNYDAVLYDLQKRDDILSFTDRSLPGSPSRSTNAGATQHRGLELGLGAKLGEHFRIDGAYSYSKQIYKDWIVPGAGDFSGKEIEAAPRVMANTRLTWRPIATLRTQLEWSRIGSYWLDQSNTEKYEGHDLFNLRANFSIGKHVEIFGSIINMTDKRFADSAQLQGATPVYSPGLPRTFYAGIEFKL